MEVTLGKLWQMDGVLISVPEELADKYVPAGLYHFIDRNEGALMLLSRGRLFYLEEYDDDYEVVVIDMTSEGRIDALIEAYTILNIQLIGDGWTMNGDKHFNLKEYDDKLKAFVNLRNTLESKELSESEELLG